MKITHLSSLVFIASILLTPRLVNAADPTAPRDWRWVEGAVFVPTNAVNEAQQWDEYDPEINDRELHYASIYGINVVRVYLHYYVYLKDKDRLLRNIEDFLHRANKYGLKTEFVFFDDCWNQPPEEILKPDYKYPAPIPGVHNSQWLVSPGAKVQSNYEQHRERLKAYVQDIVSAHKDDPRICFWEIYNEPNKSPETIRLGKDAARWIKETGSRIPATATGNEFSGEQYSDFKSWHLYGSYAYVGSPSELNTECMNREGQDVPGIVRNFRGKTGFILWELGIGRDNCRFAWSENREKPRPDEAVVPFHGLIYPDGHPWSVADIKALLGEPRFAETAFFEVRYYADDHFGELAKQSIVPFIDFDLGDEAGTGSPDATARVPKDHFSVEYSGTIIPPQSGSYRFYADSDASVVLLLDENKILEKTDVTRTEKSVEMRLEARQVYRFRARYVHALGSSSLHLKWSGPGLTKCPVYPSLEPLAN